MNLSNMLENLSYGQRERLNFFTWVLFRYYCEKNNLKIKQVEFTN